MQTSDSTFHDITNHICFVLSVGNMVLIFFLLYAICKHFTFFAIQYEYSSFQ
jgi:hypothetical protein